MDFLVPNGRKIINSKQTNGNFFVPFELGIREKRMTKDTHPMGICTQSKKGNLM